MAPDIGDVVSTCFYNGKLKPDVAYRRSITNYCLTTFLTRSLGLDTPPMGERGFEQVSEGGEDKVEHGRSSRCYEPASPDY